MKKILLGVLALTLVLSSCAKNDNKTTSIEKTSTQYSVVDSENRTVVFKDVPTTVVIMSDTAISPLVQLGKASNIIGIDTKVLKSGKLMYSCLKYPEILDLPLVGSVKEPNFEKLIELNPDVIIIKSRGMAADTIQSKTGIPVISTKTIDGFIYNYYEILGKVFKEEEKANSLIAFMESKINMINEKIKDIPESDRKSFFCSIYVNDRDFGNTFKAITSLDIAGAKNVAKNANNVNSWGLATVSSEQILEWNPDYLILELPTNKNDATIKELREDPILAMTDAVKNDSLLYTYGSYSIPKDLPRILTEGLYFCHKLYPQLFSLEFTNEQIEEVNRFTYDLGLVTPVEN